TNRNRVRAFVRIDHLTEFKSLEFSGSELTIGAGVTYTEYLEKASELLPPLTEAISLIASPSIRNTATFGGNIVNASPAADTLPILYALDAVLTLESVRSVRHVPVHEFITGPKKTILRPDELLTEIRLNIPQNYKYSYRKIGPRKALSLSKVSFVGFSLPDTGEIRLAYGSVGPTVIRAYEAEMLYRSGKINEIPNRIERTVKPISDQRSTADYRRYLCRALTEEFLTRIG
ncbi:MAG: FAD binding domain-containing protein, partial [Candidatus Marinimicrobia bacterium]|nr:FAD binding domain-containing protein [Candidatus Neomarinimicrobiota bacterium]